MKSSLSLRASALVLATAAIAPLQAATYTMQDAFKVGLFVHQNASVGSAETEASVVVGGDLTTTKDPFQIRLRAGAGTLDNVALAVGGTITTNRWENSQVIRVSGSVTYGSVYKTYNYPEGGAGGTVATADVAGLIDTSFSMGEATGGTTEPRTVTQGTVDVTQAFASLQALSNRISTLAQTSPAATSATTYDAGSGKTYLTLAKGTAVTDSSIMTTPFYLFNVNASDLKWNTFDPTDFSGWNQSDLIVINVINNLGTDTINVAADFGEATYSGPANPWADNILWNISDGNLTVSTGSKPFIGSVLAPNSTFLADDSQAVEGSVIANNYVGTYGGEIHPASFSGTLVDTSGSVVPEPTSALAGGLLLMGLARRSRKAR